MQPRIARVSTCLLATTVLGACQHRQTITYPDTLEAGAIEAGFDCAQLDDAILKTEAVRWVMRQDGARLLTPNERAARTTADVTSMLVVNTLCLFCVSPVNLKDEGHRALDGIDHRLLSLLKLKRDKHCPAAPTARPAMTDLQMYNELADLVAHESPKDPPDDIAMILEQRTELLDALRP